LGRSDRLAADFGGSAAGICCHRQASSSSFQQPQLPSLPTFGTRRISRPVPGGTDRPGGHPLPSAGRAAAGASRTVSGQKLADRSLSLPQRQRTSSHHQPSGNRSLRASCAASCPPVQCSAIVRRPFGLRSAIPCCQSILTPPLASPLRPQHFSQNRSPWVGCPEIQLGSEATESHTS
jgi:hypothetical protein